MTSFEKVGKLFSRSLFQATTIKEFIQADFYRARNPDVAAAGVDPVQHYLEFGDREGRKPNPIFYPAWYRATYDVPASKNALEHYISYGEQSGFLPNPIFNPSYLQKATPLNRGESALLAYLNSREKHMLRISKFIDLAFYLEQNPDLHSVDLIEHFLDHGHKEGRSFSLDYFLRPLRGTKNNRALILGDYHYEFAEKINILKYWDQVEPLISIEPDLGVVERSRRSLWVARINREDIEPRLFDNFLRDLPGPVDRIIAAPWIRYGGADLVTMNFYGWLRDKADTTGRSSLLLITAAEAAEARNWIPSDAIVRYIPPMDDAAQRIHFMAKLLTALQPKAILNINSDLMWATFRDYGKQLSSFINLYAGLFCFDYDKSGARAGYARDYLRACIPYLHTIYTDNHTFIQEVSEYFGFTDRQKRKFKTLYQPIAAQAIRLASAKCIRDRIQQNNYRPRILWAGRFSRQKRVDLLASICEALVECDVSVYGYDYDDNEHVSRLRLLPNVSLHGAYPSFYELPLASFDLFLYTSNFDGLPNVLIEAAAAGLPIVSSDVGGIRELLGDGAGALVPNDPKAFVSAVRKLLLDPDRLDQQVLLSQQRIDTNHDPDQCRDRAYEAPSFLT